MILIDINQVILSGLMAQIDQKKEFDMPEDMLRHIVLNIIRAHVKKFKNKYGQVVICCDNRKYWRKEVFEFYKASRKKSREKSKFDWHYIFDMLAKFKNLGVQTNFSPNCLEKLSSFEVIVRTPSVRPDLPELAQAVADKALLTSNTKI